MFDLTENTALITGASGGIGAAIARALHQQGATVVLHGTRAERLAALADELGTNAHVVTANLSSREEVAGLANKAAEAAGASEAGSSRTGPSVRDRSNPRPSMLAALTTRCLAQRTASVTALARTLGCAPKTLSRLARARRAPCVWG